MTDGAVRPRRREKSATPKRHQAKTLVYPRFS